MALPIFTGQKQNIQIQENEIAEILIHITGIKNASGELDAEALYYRAYFENKEQKFETSNATVQKLAKDYSSYKYYAAKGLVVMAKNFYALEDAYQATYILESVIESFSEFDDVVEEAQTELSTIKTEEAKTNSSIESEKGN